MTSHYIHLTHYLVTDYLIINLQTLYSYIIVVYSLAKDKKYRLCIKFSVKSTQETENLTQNPKNLGLPETNSDLDGLPEILIISSKI